MAKMFERTIVTFRYNLGRIERTPDGFSVNPTRTIDFDDKPSDRALKKALEPGEQVLTTEKVETLYRCTLEDFLKIAKVVEPDDAKQENAVNSKA